MCFKGFLTKQFSVFRHSNISLEQEIIERATAAFKLPVSPVRPIKEVMGSPIKTRVSFVGHLVSVSNQVFIKKIRSRATYGDMFFKDFDYFLNFILVILIVRLDYLCNSHFFRWKANKMMLISDTVLKLE